MLDPHAIAREQELVGKLRALENTGLIVSLTDTEPSSNVRKARWSVLMPKEARTPQSLLMVISKTDPQSNASRLWLRQLRSVLDEQEKQYPDDDQYMIGGVAATTSATDGVIFDALPKVILITLCTTFLLLIYFMRALLVPFKAIVLNFLCVLAAYGFQVLWFQDGWGRGLGQFPQTAGLNTIVMVVLFCTLFGLSMDYEVFILCAIRESWFDQHSMKIAIEDGLQKTAGIITSAAVIMVSVFLCFAFGSVVETQQLGIGLSFAVLLDATVIRLILAPSAMAIMGKWSWWLPGRGHVLPAKAPTPKPDHTPSAH
jgi:RND superfamily putative drug exporter